MSNLLSKSGSFYYLKLLTKGLKCTNLLHLHLWHSKQCLYFMVVTCSLMKLHSLFSFLATLSCVGANKAPGLWSESFTPLTVQVSVFYVTHMFIHESSFDTFRINNNRHILMSPLWSVSFTHLTVQAVSVFCGRHVFAYESSISTNITNNIRHISGCKADFQKV